MNGTISHNIKVLQPDIEELDSQTGRGINRSEMMSLTLGDWFSSGHCILISGPTGAGKSWLACALAQYACRRGYSAVYQRVPRLQEELCIKHGSGVFNKWLLQLAKTDVLILDDWGMGSIDSATRSDLLEIIDDRAVVRIAFYSGMRLSEILNCKLDHGRMIAEDTKNGDRRIIPMHNKIKSCAKYIPFDIPARTLQGQFKVATRLLGLAHIHIHDLRHSAASEMINNGVDLYTVGAVLGHKSVVSTKRYSHLATDTLATALATIGQKMHSKR